MAANPGAYLMQRLNCKVILLIGVLTGIGFGEPTQEIEQFSGGPLHLGNKTD